MLDILGSHARIIQSRGLTTNGLLLEFAPNGNLNDYLTAHPDVSLEQRITWCVQLTEGVDYFHSKRILYCDLRSDNLLLDTNLNLKVSDFQGQHFSINGEIILDALSLESTKEYLPREPADHSSVKTDLFALGSTIYFIITGHEVFPGLDKSQDEEEIERRFRAGEFPMDEHVCISITVKCWRQFYLSARQVLTDLVAIQEAVAGGESLNSIIKRVVPALNVDLSPPATSWLSSLCDGQTTKVPPPYRRAVGFG